MNLNDPSFWRPILIPAVLGLIVLNLVGMALLIRHRHDRFAPGRRWAMRIFGFSVVAIVALLYATTPTERRASFLRDSALGLAVVLTIPLLVVVWWLVAVVRLRNGPVGRATRQARRGDLAGAIAALQGIVDRGLARVTEVAPRAVDAADPWAAPVTSSTIVSRQSKQLAQQIGTLGELEAQREQWAVALTHFRHAERIDPTCPRYPVNQAISLVNLGRHGEGLSLLDAALAHLPPTDPLASFQILRQAAAVHLALRRLDAVGPLLDRADAALRRVPLPAPLRRPLARPLADLRRRLADALAPVPAPDSAARPQEIAS